MVTNLFAKQILQTLRRTQSLHLTESNRNISSAFTSTLSFPFETPGVFYDSVPQERTHKNAGIVFRAAGKTRAEALSVLNNFGYAQISPTFLKDP